MSIARKYTLITLLLVLFLGSVFTPLKVISTYRREVEDMSREIDQIERSHLPTLISSLWLTNDELVRKQVDSIAQFLYIDRVVVVNDEGLLFTAESPSSPPEADPEYKVHRQVLTYTYKDESVEVGSLTLFVNLTRMKSDAFYHEAQYLVFQIISAGIIAVAVSLLFHLLVGRHLRRFSAFLAADGPGTLSVPFSFSRRTKESDELEQLASSVNTMRSKLNDHFDQNEILLREVHHRIKNNMATMESLLQLQIADSKSPEAASVLTNAKNRLHSMGVLYDRLYKKGAVNAMPVEEYFISLVTEILKNFSFGDRVEVKTRFDDLVLPAKALSTLGIMLNEMVTNSVKHAFPDQQAGEILIEVASVPPNTARLVYRDNGIGIPDTAIQGDVAGLGMTLIRALTEQLNGSIEIGNDGGAYIGIVFPYEPVTRTAKTSPGRP